MTNNSKKLIASVCLSLAFFCFLGIKTTLAYADEHIVNIENSTSGYSTSITIFYDPISLDNIITVFCGGALLTNNITNTSIDGDGGALIELDQDVPSISYLGYYAPITLDTNTIVISHQNTDYFACVITEMQFIDQDNPLTNPPSPVVSVTSSHHSNLNISILDTADDPIEDIVLIDFVYGSLPLSTVGSDQTFLSSSTLLHFPYEFGSSIIKNVTTGVNSFTWNQSSGVEGHFIVAFRDNTPYFWEMFEGYDATYSEVNFAKSVLCDVGEDCHAVFNYNQYADGSIIYLIPYEDIQFPDYAVASTTVSLGYDMEGIILLPTEYVATTTRYGVYTVYPDTSVSLGDFNSYWLATSSLEWDYNIDEACLDMATTTTILGGIECAFRRLVYWSFTPQTHTMNELNRSRENIINAFPFSVFNQVSDVIASTTLMTTTTKRIAVNNPWNAQETITIVDQGDSSLAFISPEAWAMVRKGFTGLLYFLGFMYFVIRIFKMTHKSEE